LIPHLSVNNLITIFLNLRPPKTFSNYVYNIKEVLAKPKFG